MPEITRVGAEFSDGLSLLWKVTFEQAYKDTHSADNIEAYCDTHFTPTAARKILNDPKAICKIAGPIDAPLGYFVLRAEPCPALTTGSSYE